MTSLEALARVLANNPADEVTLAAFVDLLKEAEPERAMEGIRLLLDTRDAWHMDVIRRIRPVSAPQIVTVPGLGDVVQTPAPVQPSMVPVDPYRVERWNGAAEEARRQRERDEAAGRLFYVGTAHTSANPLEGL